VAVDIGVKDLLALNPRLDPAALQRLIDGTVARAAALAPCILDDDFPFNDAAQAVLIDVILRRAEVGAGAIQSETAGPHSRTYWPPAANGRALFWPGEIAELQGLCLATSADQGAGGAIPAYAMPDAPPDLWEASPWPQGSGT
jgi:hypothetical protein